VRLTINIEKKYVWILGLLLIAVGLVIAYGEGTPDKVGHMQKDLYNLDTNGNNIPDNAELLSGKTMVEVQRGAVPILTHTNCEWIVVGGGWTESVCPKGKFLAGMRHQTTKYDGGVRAIYCCTPY